MGFFLECAAACVLLIALARGLAFAPLVGFWYFCCKAFVS